MRLTFPAINYGHDKTQSVIGVFGREPVPKNGTNTVTVIGRDLEKNVVQMWAAVSGEECVMTQKQKQKHVLLLFLGERRQI